MHRTIKPIETVEEHEDAKTRIVELNGHPPGTPEDRERQALLVAVAKWESDHGAMPRAIRPETD